MNALNTPFNLAGRLLISAIFLLSGINKIFSYDGMQGYMEAMGVPGSLLPLVIVTEIVGSLMIIIGYQARIAAIGLAGFSIISALLFHFDLADQMQFIMFMKNLAIAGGLLIIAANGAGQLSIDNKAK